jgi:hypothetical protein
MPGPRTEITEIATALGTLARSLDDSLPSRPSELVNVADRVWDGIVLGSADPGNAQLFAAAFANGAAFLHAVDGLRGRVPRLVEWKGPHRPPGDDVIPADIRIDHVFQISCKYLSKILQNCGPARLFDRSLMGEQRSKVDWFGAVAPAEYQAFYDAIRAYYREDLPANLAGLSSADRGVLKHILRVRTLPEELQPDWAALCTTVSTESARRWNGSLPTKRERLRMLWRLLRIGDAPYFILGAAEGAQLRLRVASAWDWRQDFDLKDFEIEARASGQPEVAWRAQIHERASGRDVHVDGHVEVRWSHGRFQGSPEAKIYLDTPHSAVPGFYALV